MTGTQALTGKTALVTGSTSGIGLAIAKHLGAAGANLVMNGLGTTESIAHAVEEVRSVSSGNIVFSDADMRSSTDIVKMIEGAEKETGQIDILVNNAGIQHVSPVEDFPADRWDDIIAVNLSSVFHAVRCALPAMKRAGWGRIINIASAHALVASPFKTAYVSAKHGVAGLTKTVALEAATDGVTVNAIAPGFVDTPLVSSQLDNVARSHMVSREQAFEEVVLASQPTGKLIGVEEVASLALYLCNDAASSITGAILPIDGAWTAK